MRAFVGGYDYTSNSSCFFNCMEYIGKEVYDDKKYILPQFGIRNSL